MASVPRNCQFCLQEICTGHETECWLGCASWIAERVVKFILCVSPGYMNLSRGNLFVWGGHLYSPHSLVVSHLVAALHWCCAAAVNLCTAYSGGGQFTASVGPLGSLGGSLEGLHFMVVIVGVEDHRLVSLVSSWGPWGRRCVANYNVFNSGRKSVERLYTCQWNNSRVMIKL